MLKARVDRHRCVGAGNCITIAPTAFDWVEGDFSKADVLEAETVEEEQLREAALSCPAQALACAVAIQRQLADHRKTAGFAPQVRIGVHAAGATQVGRNFTGKGVHEASRIAGLAEGSEIIASRETAAGGRFPVSEPRTVDIRGMAEPIDVVSVQWK